MQVNDLNGLFSLILHNPTLARHLKSDPARFAEMFGISLSREDAARIAEKLDINVVAKFATEVDSMPAKVAQGVGITQGGVKRAS